MAADCVRPKVWMLNAEERRKFPNCELCERPAARFICGVCKRRVCLQCMTEDRAGTENLVCAACSPTGARFG